MQMLIMIKKYDIEVKYVPGKQVPISDLLSRQPMSQTLDEYEGLDLHVHTVIKCLTFKDSRLEQLRVDTSRDSQMQALKNF